MTVFSRILCFLLLSIASFSFYYQNEAIVVFDGKRMDFHSTPIIKKNRLNIPLKETAHNLNLSYLKNNATISLEDGFKKIIYHKNIDKVLVNNKPYFMPQNMFFYKTDYYVPISFFSWYLGYTMQRKGQIYYISKILGKAVINANSIQLIFSCRIDDKNFKLVKTKNGQYSLDLPHTSLNFPRINKSNSTFKKFFISQITTKPSRAKAIIESNQELELIKTMNSIIIKPIKNTSPVISEEIVTTKTPPKQIKKISSKGRSTSKATWIPSFEGISNIKLSVKGRKKVLSGKAKHIGTEFIVPLENTLLPFGYNHTIDKEQKLSVKYGDKQEIHTNIKTHKIGNTYYAPLQSLAKTLGLGLRWDYRIHTLFVNPIIYNVSFKKTKLGDSIIIKSYNEMDAKNIFELNNPPRLVLDIPNAVLDVKKQIIPIKNSNFKKIRVAQLDEETVRVVVDLHQAKSYGLSISDDGTTATIHGAGKIQKVGYWQGKTRDKVTIFTNNLSHYKWKRQNNQLIIDFDNMNYSAKQSYVFTKAADLKKIIGVQYNWDPLTARMTFYFDNKFTFNLKEEKNNLVLLINKRKISKTTKQKKSQPPVKMRRNPLNGKVIVVEAGHGGIDVGAIGYGNRYEKWFTLDISKRIQKRLIAAGATVLMPLTYDKYMSLSSRTMFANRNKADFYLSVHLNSFVKSYAKGCESYYYKYNDRLPAKYIQQSLVKHLKRHDKGIKQRKLFVLYHTKMPAVLIEPAFVSNPTEYNLLLTSQFREKIALAVVEGLKKYYAN